MIITRSESNIKVYIARQGKVQAYGHTFAQAIKNLLNIIFN